MIDLGVRKIWHLGLRDEVPSPLSRRHHSHPQHAGDLTIERGDARRCSGSARERASKVEKPITSRNPHITLVSAERHLLRAILKGCRRSAAPAVTGRGSVLCAARPGSLRLSAHLRGFGVYRGLMEASGLSPERKRLAPHCRRGWVLDGGQKSLQRMRQLHVLDQLRL